MNHNFLQDKPGVLILAILLLLTLISISSIIIHAIDSLEEKRIDKNQDILISWSCPRII